MLKLAQRINQLADNKEINGFVITHGTDTMEETAYFLNLVTKTNKPVVLVGSMRPSTAVSADGPLNLYDAIAVAADPNAQGRGVLLVMNDWIHSAQTLTKVSTTAVQTFMSPIRGLIGTSSYGVNDFYRYPDQKFGIKSEFIVESVTKLPRVDIVYADVDMPADLIDASVNLGAKGIVIAGVGNGNMPKAALEACARASKKGVIVVRSTRVATGTVGRNIECNDDELGLVASYNLNPQKSRILLMVTLLKPRKLDEVQKIFIEY
jgi:L-asparaginase